VTTMADASKESGNDSFMADPYASPGKINTGSLGPAFGGDLYLPSKPAPLPQPDYLFEENYQEDYRRSWGERLTFHIGGAYLAGLTTGGVYGLYEGLKGTVGDRRSIRINSVLNAMGKRGPGWGNGLGCVAMMWSTFETIALTVRGEDDILNPAGAAALTGLIYKSTAGPRVAAAAGLGLSAFAAGATFLSKQFSQRGMLKSFL